MKKLKKWEKIFIISNIIIILSIISIYIYRTIHYYIMMNVNIEKDTSLKEVITNKGNIVYSGDGLYDDEDYYFKGNNVNNYVMYSNNLWRIISIDEDNIKLISDDVLTSIVWGYDTKYEESYIYNLVNNLGIDEDLLVNSKWCDSGIDIDNYECDNYIEGKVGLLSSYEYKRAGGENSYLNINEYYWLINYDKDMKVYYVYDKGGINNEYKSNSTYYSYGVRPVINISNSVGYTKGDGTKENPYVIGSDYKIGKNINYNGYSFKIIATNEEYTKLILNDYLYDENNEKVKLNYNDSINYIKNNFVNKFDNLIECDFNKNSYNNSNKYNYLDISSYRGYGYLPIVGEIYSNEIDDVWLGTSYSDNLSYTVSGSSLFADLNSNTNYIRPVICVKTSSLEEQDEVNN